MSQRLNDFLAREAGDYLERMTRILTGSTMPDPDELSRLARGVRGSAQMASASGVAELAERLEDELRSLAAGHEHWDDDSRERLLRGVHELEGLLYAQGSDLIPISDLFYDDEGPHVMPSPAPAGAAAGAPVVSVEELLYSGDRALTAASSLRAALQDAVAAGDRSRSLALLDELFDLIRLAGSASA